ncbi:MAG TPA: hypothetical protein VFE09_07195 [Rubrobacteraceae bacterium]|nr:hypothetical protein [Rubrobacteraceae bacterium]
MQQRGRRRILVERRVLGVPGVLCVLVLVLALVGCGGGSEDEGERAKNEPVRETTTEEAAAAENVVVRVSGTQGLAYSGSYGTAREVRNVNDTALGAEPKNYELEEVGSEEGAVNAVFKKSSPGRETLMVEILVDGEVLTRSETSAELGSVTVNWVPQEALSEERTMLPKEFE